MLCSLLPPYALLFPSLGRVLSIPSSPPSSYELPNFPPLSYAMPNLPLPLMTLTISPLGISNWFWFWQPRAPRVRYWLRGIPSPSESAYDANSEWGVPCMVSVPPIFGSRPYYNHEQQAAIAWYPGQRGQRISIALGHQGKSHLVIFPSILTDSIWPIFTCCILLSYYNFHKFFSLQRLDPSLSFKEAAISLWEWEEGSQEKVSLSCPLHILD